MKKLVHKKHISLTVLFYILTVSGIMFVVNACTHKPKIADSNAVITSVVSAPAKSYIQGQKQSKIVTVLGINETTGNTTETSVIFSQLEEIFTVTDPAVLTSLKNAYGEKKAIKITFDPWKGIVTEVNAITDQERAIYYSREIISSAGTSIRIDLSSLSEDVLNRAPEMGVINTTTPGLTSVIPDMATAQLMFDYIVHQSCGVPGPYGVDYCITFQYCEDGCYARAHKMCYVLNNRYHYATKKVFSFAYPSPSTLSVKAEKWGGCCIRWWYHVAPLVSIKTPTGTKAYVFDPAMFDQPVLLSTWLHAQQNPVCQGGSIARVTSYNIQPTSAYSPAYYGDTTTFATDPMYADTDSTMVNYHSLVSCP